MWGGLLWAILGWAWGISDECLTAVSGNRRFHRVHLGNYRTAMDTCSQVQRAVFANV